MNKLYEEQAKKQVFLPTVEKTSTFFQVKNSANAFYKSISKIQARLHDGINGNRAKLNYLQIIWKNQCEKLVFDYAKKNKKKGEYNNIIAQISDIETGPIRDSFLNRYLARCKLTNALAFF